MRRHLRYAIVFLVWVLASQLGPAPARADADLSVASADWLCTTTAGVRQGWWYVDSHVDAPGTLVAIGTSASGAMREHTEVGTAVGKDTRFHAHFFVGRGPTQITLTAKVRWDQRPDGGPLEATVTHTQRLNDCEEHPTAKLRSKCDGSVEIIYGNGGPNDLKLTGGEVTFEILGSNGYRLGPYSPNSWRGMSTAIVPPDRASWVKVIGNGTTLLVGQYQAAPGCVGYVEPVGQPPAAPPPGGQQPNPATGDAPVMTASPAPPSAPPSTVESGPVPPGGPVAVAEPLLARNSAESDSYPMIGYAAGLFVLIASAIWYQYRRKTKRDSEM